MRDGAECFCPGDLFLDFGIFKDPRPRYEKPRWWWGRGQSALVLVCSSGHQRPVSEVLGRCLSAAGHSTGARALVSPQPRNRDWGVGLWNPSTWGPPGLVLAGKNLGPKSSILSGWPPKPSICPRATSSLRPLLPWAQRPASSPCSVTALVLWIFSVGSHTDANVCGAENKHGIVKPELLTPLNPRTHLPVKPYWPF